MTIRKGIPTGISRPAFKTWKIIAVKQIFLENKENRVETTLRMSANVGTTSLGRVTKGGRVTTKDKKNIIIILFIAF